MSSALYDDLSDDEEHYGAQLKIKTNREEAAALDDELVALRAELQERQLALEEQKSKQSNAEKTLKREEDRYEAANAALAGLEAENSMQRQTFEQLKEHAEDVGRELKEVERRIEEGKVECERMREVHMKTVGEQVCV